MFRADAGFYRPKLLEWCDRNGVDYLVGFSKNSRLLKEVQEPMARVHEHYQQSGEKTRDV